jgi:hypothetical protein
MVGLALAEGESMDVALVEDVYATRNSWEKFDRESYSVDSPGGGIDRDLDGHNALENGRFAHDRATHMMGPASAPMHRCLPLNCMSRLERELDTRNCLAPSMEEQSQVVVRERRRFGFLPGTPVVHWDLEPYCACWEKLYEQAQMLALARRPE